MSSVEPASKQAFKKDLKDAVLPISVTFLMGKGNLAKEFHLKLDEKSPYAAKDHAVLELTPKSASAHYTKIVLVVDAKSGAVARSIVFEPSGNTNDFRFKKVKSGKDAKVLDSLFVVDEKALAKDGLKVIEPD